jgi:hypothetical protein
MAFFSLGEGHPRHHPLDDKLFAAGDNRAVATLASACGRLGNTGRTIRATSLNGDH